MTLLRRIIAFTFTAMTVAALLQTSFTPAWACTCLPALENGQLAQEYGSYDLIVEGAIAPRGDGDPVTQLRFDIDTAFKGDAPAQVRLEMGYFVVDQPTPTTGELDSLGPDCKYAIYGGPGEKYVLFLSADGSGAYRPGGCGSFALVTAQQYSYYRDVYDVLTALLTSPTPGSIPAAGGQPLQADASDGSELPTYIILPAAFLVPLAVLFIWTFVIRPKGGDGH